MTTVSDAEALRLEVERLRAENEQLARKVEWRRQFRRASSGLLLVLGCGLVALSLVAIWLRVTLLNTDRYVDTVAPIAAEPAVQAAVADKIETAIFTRVDFAGLAREVLPERADVLAPAIERGVQGVISDRIEDFTRSQRFQELWVEANRRAHTRVVELLTGGRSGRLELRDDTVYLDLSALVDRVRSALQERGLTRIANAIPPTVDGQVELFQSSALADAQRGVRLLKGLAILLPLLALLCLAGSVWLARRRRRALVRVAVGIVIAMLTLVALLAVARSLYLDALGQGALPRDAASNIFDTLVELLRFGGRIVVAVAVVVALIAFLSGLPLRRYAGTAWDAVATSPRRSWVAEHQRVLMGAVGVVAMIVLLAANPLTGGTVLLVLLLGGAAVGAIAAVGARPPRAGEADPPRHAAA
ncbi:MAG TPA: hypothetical protein VFZ00_16455 [Solirubrobacter sp.]|nr:hypothetical protein [Solirubrobacter sp.]